MTGLSGDCPSCDVDGSLAERVLGGDIMHEILGCLCLRERHQAALVCRQWRELVHSPQLLRSINVSLDCTNPGVLPVFCAWLGAQAAGRVERLHLALRAHGLMHALRGEADAQLLFAALRACGTGPRPLQELRLLVDSQLAVDSCHLGALRSTLRHLRLDATSKSHESASTALYCFALHELTELQELWVCGSAVELHRSGLPPSLTLLHLSGHRDLTARNRHSPPHQLEALGQLRSLHLRGVYCNTPSCYHPLLRLPALEQLALTSCTHLPACLPRLTNLKVLCLSRAPMDERSRAPELAAALHSLTGLTHLALHSLSFPEPGVRLPRTGLPSEVAAPLQRLAQLRRFLWTRQACGRAAGGGGDGDEPIAGLPSGPWLAGLKALALDSSIAPLQSSLHALSGATQLEELAVQLAAQAGSASLPAAPPELAVAAWAHSHPSLRRLAFVPADGSHPRHPGLCRLASALQSMQLRPGLEVQLGAALLWELGCLQPGRGDQPVDFAF